jgi:hypothetical protein
MRRRDLTKAAVIATLASRPAWAQTCDGQLISANTMHSFTGGSLSPGQEDLLTDLTRAMNDTSKVVTQFDDSSVCITSIQAQFGHNKLLRQRERFEEN